MNRSICFSRSLFAFSVRTFASSVKHEPTNFEQMLDKTHEFSHLWRLIKEHGQLDPFEVRASMKAVLHFSQPSIMDIESKPSTAAMMQDENFQALCQQTSALVMSMSPPELVHWLTLLTRFSMPVESPLFSQLLTTINKCLYGFSTYQIDRIVSILKYLQTSPSEPNSQVESIMSSIRLLKTDRIFSHDSLDSLTHFFCSQRNNSKSEILVSFDSIYSSRLQLNELQCINTLAGIHRHFYDLLAFNEAKMIELINVCLNRLVELDPDLNIPELLFTNIFFRFFRITKVHPHPAWFSKAREVLMKRIKIESGVSINSIIEIFDIRGQDNMDFLLAYEKELARRKENNETLRASELFLDLSLTARIMEKLPHKDDEKRQNFFDETIKAIYARRGELPSGQYLHCLRMLVLCNPQMFNADLETAGKLINFLFENLPNKMSIPHPTFMFLITRLSKMNPTFDGGTINRYLEISRENMHKEQTHFLLLQVSTLVKYGHFPFDIVKVCDKRVFEEDLICGRPDPIDWPKYLNVLTMVPEYTPHAGWNAVLNILLPYFQSQCKEFDLHRVINLVYNLSSIGKFDDVLMIELCARLESNADFITNFPLLGILYNLTYISSALHLNEIHSPGASQLRKTLRKFMPNIIETIHTASAVTPEVAAFGNALSDVLGGRKYFVPGVWYKYGFFVHNLVAFGKNNRPIPMNLPDKQDEPLFFSSIKLPPDAVLLSILPLTELDTTRQGMIKRACNMRMNFYKKIKICPVTFGTDTFDSLSEYDKKSFLKKLIKNKLNELNEK